jgi:hypothetical protein
MRLGLRRHSVIHSAWLVRVLAGSRRVHRCSDCEGRMFVRAPSGLCPVCYTRRRQRDERLAEIVHNETSAALHDWAS